MPSGRYRLSFGVLLALVALQLLQGCNGFFTDRSTTTTSSSQRFAYVSNFNNAGAGTISLFTLDTNTGALASNGSSVATGASTDILASGPAALVTANAGAFLYSANDGGGVSAFAVNSNSGALTTVSGSPFAANLSAPTAITADPGSKFLYVADSNGVGVAVLTINSSTGALTGLTGSPFSTGGLRCVGITVHPNSKFLYMALEAFGTGIFTVDTTSGALSNFTIVAPFANGQPQAIAITPAGTLAYIANGFSGVEAYRVDTNSGSLAKIGSAAFATGNNPIAIVTDTSGKFVYVTNRDDTNAANNTLTALAIQSDGSLASISSGVVAVNSPSSLALDPTGKFVFVTNFNNATVAIFSINSTTGQLTSAGSVSTGTNPSSIAFR